jgi:hypothetical protein
MSVARWGCLGIVALVLAPVLWLAGGLFYVNTPLGCRMEEDHPPLVRGTAEYAAMEKATKYAPDWARTVSSDGASSAYLYRPDPSKGYDRQYVLESRDHWLIVFREQRKKSALGCVDSHVGGAWIAEVRKRDLAVMNQKDFP